MAENITNVDVVEQSISDYTAYAAYVARCRAIPDYIDGLKPVIRRILYCSAHDFKGQGFVKTAALIGEVIKSYNPHGDASVQMAIRNMINDFSTKYPTMDGDGSWGSKVNPYPAQPRYNDCKISQFAIDVFMQDIYDDPKTTDWMNNYDNKKKEPIFLPAKIPTLLVLGQMGIGVGMKSSIPSHNLGEVIDTTITLIKNPKAKFCLIPDECMQCQIIDTDWQEINNTGRGTYIAQGIIDIGEYKVQEKNGRTETHQALFVRSLPDFTFYDSIKETITKAVKDKKMPYISDLISRTKVSNSHFSKGKKDVKFEEVIVLKKDADPNFVKEWLYINTAIRQTRQVNLIVLNDKKELSRMSYREYLLNFIEFRRTNVCRRINSRIQYFNTKIRAYLPYIRLLNSKEFDTIIHMLKSSKEADRSKIKEFVMNKLRIDPLQAETILELKFHQATKGYLMKKRDEAKEFEKQVHILQDILLDNKKIDQVIIDEMTYIKNKYNSPILRVLINKSQATGIAPGIFKLIFTKNNFIRKISENENIGSLCKDEYNFMTVVDNTDNLVVFSALGKVFKIPVHKIPTTVKGGNGIDIRILNKNCTSDISCAVGEMTLAKLAKSKYNNFVFVVSNNGYIKKIDMNDLTSIPPSGIIYSKIDNDDYVKALLFGPDNMDVLVYSGNKILRIPSKLIAKLQRSTKGARVSTASSKIDGMNFLVPDMNSVIIITKKGYVNKIPVDIIPRSTRGKAGTKVIKLSKDDDVKNIIPCKPNQSIVVYEGGRTNTTIDVDKLDIGSTISPGIKLLKNPLRVHVINN